MKSKDFTADRNSLARAPGRIPIYDSAGQFQHWQIPRESIGYILQQFTTENIIASEEAQKLLDRLTLKLKPIEDLPREPLKQIVWGDRTLKPHQVEYVTINKSKTSLLVSFETGTGKSISSLVRTTLLESKRLLIVCPKKLRKNWKTEIRETFDKDCLIYWGSKKEREKQREQIPNFDIIITTHEQLEEFSKYAPDFDQAIIDEIHLICNDSTRNFKAADMFLRSHTGGVQALSATPMRLGMGDFWGVLYLIDPEFAGAKSKFLDRYEEVIATMTKKGRNGKTFKIPIKVRNKNQDELRERLKSIMVRVKKDTVVDFRDTVEIIEVDLHPKQRKMYESCLSDIQLEFQDRSVRVDNPLTRLLRLLQICEGTFNLDETTNFSGKLEYLEDELKDIGDQKAVIWSRFKPITQKIYDLFPNQTVIYSGDATESMKQLAVWAFQGVKTREDAEEYNRLKKYNPDFKFEPGEAQFFSATHSMKSGIGINLQAANLCYFTSTDLSPTAVMQARDRVSRIGQEENTLTKFIVSSDTIERRCLHAILNNYQKTLEVLDGRGDTTYKLNQELMRILLS